MRPWGRVAWMLDRIEVKQWSILGTLSSEQRGLAVWEALKSRNALAFDHLLRIHPPTSHPRGHELDALVEEEQIRFLERGGEFEHIRDHHLLERHNDIVQAAHDFLQLSTDSVIVDITSFPKRFFFPLLRFVLADDSKRNILVTYTVPEKYAQDALHEDVEAPAFLPSFMPRLDEEDEHHPPILVVAVGFESPGLTQILEEDQGAGVYYLFPFPAAPPLSKGTWDFLEEGISITDTRRSWIEGVSTRDLSSTFEKLKSVTDSGHRQCLLAPYGPKTVSLAMCLFAIGPGASSSSVRYAQPKYYNPKYSSGVATDAGGIVAYAYALRLDGHNFFE